MGGLPSDMFRKSPTANNDRPSNDLVELLEECVTSPPVEGEDERDSHDPDEPGEDEISHGETVPLAVIKKPVVSSSIVHKDHDGKRHSV